MVHQLNGRQCKNLGRAAAVVSLLGVAALLPAEAQSSSTVTIAIDAGAGKHLISPLVYGVNMANADQLKALNAPANRIGGNNTSRYNWKVNTCNLDNDGFFESPPGGFWPLPGNSLQPGEHIDTAIKMGNSAGATTLITVPMMGWVAKVVDPNTTLSSFSIKKYGPQQRADTNHPDAGNGVRADGTRITGNDPNDASVPITPAYEKPWIQHIVAAHGTAAKGGVRFYLMDNEPGIWQETHRDVHPEGPKSQEIFDKIVAYGTMVKSVDPGAQICAPEEWGYLGLIESGWDKQYLDVHSKEGLKMGPDKAAHGGMDFYPWLLQKMSEHDRKTGKRTLDVLTIHLYPQAGESGGDDSPKTALIRNRSTRSLWDPNYVDESWIAKPIMLIPRLKNWIKTYYPGVKIGITEYDWGGERSISGALAQADLLGIFGREGVEIATHWIVPSEGTPLFKAYQMYRNYDGHNGAFGSIGVSDKPSSNPDTLASFAAVRKSDGALTVMVLNKALSEPSAVDLRLAHYAAGKSAQVYQLTSANQIAHLPNISVAANALQTTLPAQSITLFVIPRR